MKEQWYRNFYGCVCGHHWQMEWTAMCDDKCPECGTAMTPFGSEKINKPEIMEEIGWEAKRLKTFLEVMPKDTIDVERMAALIEHELADGAINPLEMVRIRKVTENLFKCIKEDLDKYARDEAEKYGEKVFRDHGIEVTLTELGSKWDYSKCDDPEYNKLIADSLVLAQKMKERETFLQSLQKPLKIVDEDTGEVIAINPAVKSSTSGIKASLL